MERILFIYGDHSTIEAQAESTAKALQMITDTLYRCKADDIRKGIIMPTRLTLLLNTFRKTKYDHLNLAIEICRWIRSGQISVESGQDYVFKKMHDFCNGDIDELLKLANYIDEHTGHYLSLEDYVLG